MPFRLKNIRATYERLVKKVFKDQIGQNIEVYINDILVKSLKATNHISYLKEAFSTLYYHQMKLNSMKSTFGVTTEKFLGFLVPKHVIEVNSRKIKAILDMHIQPPKKKYNNSELLLLAGSFQNWQNIAYLFSKSYDGQMILPRSKRAD